MVAASKGKQEIAKQLLEAGAFINLQVFVSKNLPQQMIFIYNRIQRATQPSFWLAATGTAIWLISFSESEMIVPSTIYIISDYIPCTQHWILATLN